MRGEGESSLPPRAWLACLPEGPRLGPVFLSEGNGFMKPFWQMLGVASTPSLHLPPAWKLSAW